MTPKIAEKKVPQVTSDITNLISKKIVFFEDIIQRTILHVQKNKTLHIIGVSDVTNCINILAELSKKIKEINCFKNDSKGVANTDSIINICLLYTSPSPRDRTRSRMPSSA